MQSFVDAIKALQPHSFVDHFTVAILIVAVIADLVASLVPSRVWIRYMAVCLMIVGAAAAWGSNLTGGWEADRVWKEVTGPAKDVLKRHAQLGDILPWVFLVLALWRLCVEFVGFLRRSRALYLVIAVLAVIAIIYQGHEGGELVYEYGVGTAVMPGAQAPNARPAESPAASPGTAPAEPSPVPTVFVPTAVPTPAESASPLVSGSPAAENEPKEPVAVGAASPSPAVPTPMATSASPDSEAPASGPSIGPSSNPSATVGTPVSPPYGKPISIPAPADIEGLNATLAAVSPRLASGLIVAAPSA
ncbi:MAG: DUF2231 domain-containing protein [Candidatus Binataceae bacterium]